MTPVVLQIPFESTNMTITLEKMEDFLFAQELLSKDCFLISHQLSNVFEEICEFLRHEKFSADDTLKISTLHDNLQKLNLSSIQSFIESFFQSYNILSSDNSEPINESFTSFLHCLEEIGKLCTDIQEKFFTLCARVRTSCESVAIKLLRSIEDPEGIHEQIFNAVEYEHQELRALLSESEKLREKEAREIDQNKLELEINIKEMEQKNAKLEIEINGIELKNATLEREKDEALKRINSLERELEHAQKRIHSLEKNPEQKNNFEQSSPKEFFRKRPF